MTQNLNPINELVQKPCFMALDCPYEKARTVVYGAGFDSTCSNRPGTRFAAQVMRQDFIGLETYSPYLDKDLLDSSISDLGDLDMPIGQPEEAVSLVEKLQDRLLSDGKIPCMIGGEHLLTLGSFRATLKHHPDLVLVQLDAHTDLRDDYLGLKLSHASVVRRCHDLVGDGRIYQFGIRSGEAAEWLFAKEHTSLFPFNLDSLVQGIEPLIQSQVPVYLTLDLDVLDPSVFPGTGTPEPGGVSFEALRVALTELAKLHVVAFDLMELSPPYDPSGISSAAACKALREMLLLYSCAR